MVDGFYTGNVTLFAMQWAAYIGHNPIYVLGLDLHGNHGTSDRPADPYNLQKQRAQFQEAAPIIKDMGITVYNCNPKSACEVFEYKELP